MNIMAIIMAAAVIAVVGIVVGIGPVSYTHLDVYKRQRFIYAILIRL